MFFKRTQSIRFWVIYILVQNSFFFLSFFFVFCFAFFQFFVVNHHSAPLPPFPPSSTTIKKLSTALKPSRSLVHKKKFLQNTSDGCFCQKQSFADVLQKRALKSFAIFWIKMSLRHRCFPVNIAKFFTNSFLQNFSGVCFCIILKETRNSYFCVTPKNHQLCVFITLVKKAFKSSNFCNISNFHNGFVWNPSNVQRPLFERIARFF